MDVDRTLATAVGVIALIYWGCVCAMVVRVRRRARRRGESVHVLVPAQWRERLMWVTWMPLIALWITLPIVAGMSTVSGNRWMSLPAIVADDVVRVGRAGAAAIALACLAGSIVCWRHMGRHWRMAVDPGQKSPLFTDGPFGAVRHPIYALSMLMMICSAVVVPTAPMAIIGMVHVVLMNLKARNEEQHLLKRHGVEYAAYCRRTGRFVPRIGSWGSSSHAAGS